MRKQIYLALVHYPVYNKRREVVCTSVTNFDIHDIQELVVLMTSKVIVWWYRQMPKKS